MTMYHLKFINNFGAIVWLRCASKASAHRAWRQVERGEPFGPTLLSVDEMTPADWQMYGAEPPEPQTQASVGVRRWTPTLARVEWEKRPARIAQG